MENFITCDDAKALRQSIDNTLTKALLAKIDQAIRDAAKLSKTSITVASQQSAPVETFVRNRGYKIEYFQDSRDGDFYTISGW